MIVSNSYTSVGPLVSDLIIVSSPLLSRVGWTLGAGWVRHLAGGWTLGEERVGHLVRGVGHLSEGVGHYRTGWGRILQGA